MNVSNSLAIRTRAVTEAFLRTPKGCLSLVSLAVGLVALGCAEDKSEPLGHRGEFCLSRGDCSGGLACFDNECTDARFNLTRTGKECVAIECRAARDCCPEPLVDASLCTLYQEQCELSPDSGACESYDDAYCECDPDRWECGDGQCVEQCEDVGEPCANGLVCDGKRCIECQEDDDCSVDQKCVDDVCQSQCKDDLDCPVFYSCERKSCQYSGCSSDRECIAYRDDLRAYCDKEKVCQVPCTVDLECDDPYSFSSMACIGGLCVDVGCESDEECRIRLGTLVSTVGGGSFDAECRKAPKAADAE
jgi:hypothetical protein